MINDYIIKYLKAESNEMVDLGVKLLEATEVSLEDIRELLWHGPLFRSYTRKLLFLLLIKIRDDKRTANKDNGDATI